MINFSERLIIAEIGMTHDGSLGQAKAMIQAAAACGVDAVKLQMHISKEETIRNAPQPPYFKAEPRYEFFERTAFNMLQWQEIKELCTELKVKLIVSPFSIEAIERLEQLGVDAIKIPSGEITNIPYIEHLGTKNIPILVSSGMSSWEEVKDCVSILQNRNRYYAVMQCTSEYPCKPENVGFNILDDIKREYPGIAIGFSDHTEGIWADIAAWMKGATIIEKHFTLSKKMYGPDAKMSLEPDEMKQLCESIKNLEISLNNPVNKSITEELANMKRIFQKSIVAIDNIPKGTIIDEGMIGYKKPGDGLETKYYKDIIGKKVTRDLVYDDIIYYNDIEW